MTYLIKDYPFPQIIQYVNRLSSKQAIYENYNNSYQKLESHQVTFKTEELLFASENRFNITIKVAERAKRRKYEDIDILEDPLIKPVIRAILEMVDEITQPEIIGE